MYGMCCFDCFDGELCVVDGVCGYCFVLWCFDVLIFFDVLCCVLVFVLCVCGLMCV